MYTFLVVYTKNMYFYFILILYIYINRWREGKSAGFSNVVLLHFKRGPFRRQKESFWKAKGLHL